MNIWVVARSYPLKSNSFRGSFELEQAKMLAKRGHNVVFLALIFHHKNKVKKWGYCTWKDEDITVFTQSQFYAPDRFHLHLKQFQQKKWETFLKRVENEVGRPDVIHVHYPTMITVPESILAYQKFGTRIIVTEHWSRVLTQKVDNYEKKQLKTYVENADAFLCVGGPLRDAVNALTHTNHEISLVPNVVSECFKPQDKGDRHGFSFIAVGRLAPMKQFDKAIEAYYKAFGNKNDHITLTIVGGGSEEKKLRQLISRYQLEKAVILTGSLNREETAEKVAQADALVCFSRLETFGVPVIEAWACGLPVIATDALCFLECWNEELGTIVSWTSVDEMAAAMKNLYENYDKYDSEQIAKFAKCQFSEDTVYMQLVDHYLGNKYEMPLTSNIIESAMI